MSKIDENKIELGDIVEDIHTGYVGVALSQTKFFNGCIQFDVFPKLKKGENKPSEGISIDLKSLKIVKKYKKEIMEKKTIKKKKSTGGRYNKVHKFGRHLK